MNKYAAQSADISFTGDRSVNSVYDIYYPILREKKESVMTINNISRPEFEYYVKLVSPGKLCSNHVLVSTQMNYMNESIIKEKNYCCFLDAGEGIKEIKVKVNGYDKLEYMTSTYLNQMVQVQYYFFQKSLRIF